MVLWHGWLEIILRGHIIVGNRLYSKHKKNEKGHQIPESFAFFDFLSFLSKQWVGRVNKLCSCPIKALNPDARKCFKVRGILPILICLTNPNNSKPQKVQIRK